MSKFLRFWQISAGAFAASIAAMTLMVAVAAAAHAGPQQHDDFSLEYGFLGR
jgi:hypothetical protein